MLYPTQNQPLIILVLILGGVLSGIFFDLSRILTSLSGNDKLSRHLFDFIATIISFLNMFFLNLWFNYGQFRIYVPLMFLAGLIVERIFSKFLWTKLIKTWYSNIMRRKGKGEKSKNKHS